MPPNHPLNRPRSRIVVALLAAIGLALGMLIASPGPARGGQLPTPTSITTSAYTDPAFLAEHLSGAPPDSIPTVLAASGDTFLVAVTLHAGSADAAYPSDQTVSLSASGPGTLTPATVTFPKNQTTTVFSVSYSAAAGGVRVTASIGKGGKALTASSNAFDILKVLNFLPGTSTSLTNGTAGADGNGCAVVDAANPVCGVVVLPRGATSDVALSLGLCPAGSPCTRGALVTQMIANLTSNGTALYDRLHPATMIITCDKTLCGNGGVNKFTALWSQSAVGALTAVPPCAAKGVIDPTLDYCTDYVSSTRDNAGDLLLHVLFDKDVRGGI